MTQAQRIEAERRKRRERMNAIDPSESAKRMLEARQRLAERATEASDRT